MRGPRRRQYPAWAEVPFRSVCTSISGFPRMLQEIGDVKNLRRAGRGGGRLPPPSHSVALADPTGLMGNGLPPWTLAVTSDAVRSVFGKWLQQGEPRSRHALPLL
jgi:hypothetical protein